MGKLIGGITQAEIDALKKEHGGLNLVTVNVLGKEKYWWFKKPDMNTVSASTSMMQNGDPVESSKIVFVNCLIKGDADAVNDVDLFINISPKLNQLTETYTTEIKKF